MQLDALGGPRLPSTLLEKRCGESQVAVHSYLAIPGLMVQLWHPLHDVLVVLLLFCFVCYLAQLP